MVNSWKIFLVGLICVSSTNASKHSEMKCFKCENVYTWKKKKIFKSVVITKKKNCLLCFSHIRTLNLWPMQTACLDCFRLQTETRICNILSTILHHWMCFIGLSFIKTADKSHSTHHTDSKGRQSSDWQLTNHTIQTLKGDNHPIGYVGPKLGVTLVNMWVWSCRQSLI